MAQHRFQGTTMSTARKVFEFLPTLMSILTIASMSSVLQLDALVHQKLYSYGLQFSFEWAIPYWATVRSAFALGWLTVAVGIGATIFLVITKPERVNKQDRQWSIYKLRDGSTVRVKHVLRSVRQLPNYAPDGAPTYVGMSDCIVEVVDFPEDLRRRTEEQRLNASS